MPLNLDVNSGNNWNVGNTATSGTGQAQATTQSGPPPGPLTNDTLSSLGGLGVMSSYIQDLSNPSLPPPNSNASDQTNQAQGQGQSQSTQDETQYETDYFNAFSSNLQQVAQDHGLDQSQTQSLLFAQMTGAPIPNTTLPDGSTMNGLLGEVQQQTTQDLMSSFGEDFPSAATLANTVKGQGNQFTNAATAQIKQLQTAANSLPPGADKTNLQNLINKLQNNLGGIQQVLSKLQNTTDPGQLSDLLSQLNDQISDFQGDISNGQNLSLSDPVAGSALSSALSALGQGMGIFSDSVTASTETNQLAQGNWNMIQSDTGTIYRSLMDATFESTFQTSVQNFATENALNPADVAMLEFAHNNPNAPGLASETLSNGMSVTSAMNTVNANAVGKMSEGWGIPPGYVPTVNNMQFNAKIENAFEKAFTDVLNANTSNLQPLAQKMGLTPSQVAGLVTYLFNNPDMASQMSSDPALMQKMLGTSDPNVLKQLLAVVSSTQSEALSQISSQNGLPPGYTVNPNSDLYNSMLNGRFQQQFNSNLNNQTPPLTQQQINDVMSALSDPTNPNISSATKSIIQQVYNQSVSEVQQQYSLPVGWSPNISSLASLTTTPPALQIANAGLGQVRDTLNIIGNYVSSMTGPGQALMINILKLVSGAIAELQQSIAQLQIVQGQINSIFAKESSDASLYKLQLQQNQISTQAQKQAKMKPFNDFMKVFGPIMKVLMAVITVVLAVVTGGIAGVVMGLIFAALTIADLASNGQVSLGNLCNIIMKSIPSPGNAIVTAVMVAVICAATLGAGAGMIGMMIAIDLFTSSGVINDILTSIPQLSPTVERWLSLAINIAISIAGCIAGVALGGFASAAEAAENVGEVLQKVAAGLTKVAGFLKEFAEVNDVFSDVADTISAAAKGIGQVASKLADLAAASNKISAAIDETQGKLDTAIEDAVNPATDDDVLKYTQMLNYLQVMQKGFDAMIHTTISGIIATDQIMSKIQLATAMVQGATQIAQGTLTIIQAQLQKKMSQIDAEIQQLESLVKIMQKMMDTLMSAMSSEGEWSGQLGQQINKMMSDASSTATAVAGANH